MIETGIVVKEGLMNVVTDIRSPGLHLVLLPNEKRLRLSTDLTDETTMKRGSTKTTCTEGRTIRISGLPLTKELLMRPLRKRETKM